MAYPNPVITARRNLARRIERFVVDLETAVRDPTQVEGAHVAEAIACLRQDLCADGETRMLYAEKGWAGELVEASDEAMTASRLRELLGEAIAELGL